MRVQAGPSHLVNTKPGITARTTNNGGGSGGGSETTFFTRMPNGRLLSMRTTPSGGSAGSVHYYVTDHNKTVLGLINNNGQRAGTYRYTPTANPHWSRTPRPSTPTRSAGSAPTNIPTTSPAATSTSPPATTTHHRRLHPTRPQPGNMREPLRLNPYLYAAGDPINNTDPSGRYWGEDVVDSVTEWEGWDEVWETVGLLGSCVGSGAFGLAYGGAVGSAIPGVGTAAGAAVGASYGCMVGMVFEGVAGYNPIGDPQGVY